MIQVVGKFMKKQVQVGKMLQQKTERSAIIAKLYDYTIEDPGLKAMIHMTKTFDREPTQKQETYYKHCDDIFVGDLNKEYNTLFIGLRYVLWNNHVNWLFKIHHCKHS